MMNRVSRALRSASSRCAADTDLGSTRDRHSNMRKSGKPDLAWTVTYTAFAMVRISGAPLRYRSRYTASGTRDTHTQVC